MKKLVTILLVLISLNSYCQTPLSYEKIIQCDSTSKDKIYTALMDWVATNFKSAKDVVQLADKENGLIICKGAFDYYYEAGSFLKTPFSGYIEFSLRISIKDNKYKINTSDFKENQMYAFGTITDAPECDYHEFGKGKFNDCWHYLQVQTKSQSENIFVSMQQKTKDLKNNAAKNDNW